MERIHLYEQIFIKLKKTLKHFIFRTVVAFGGESREVDRYNSKVSLLRFLTQPTHSVKVFEIFTFALKRTVARSRRASRAQQTRQVNTPRVCRALDARQMQS